MPGTKILSPISGDDPVLFSNIDGPYREGSNLSMEIERRGEDTNLPKHLTEYLELYRMAANFCVLLRFL